MMAMNLEQFVNNIRSQAFNDDNKALYEHLLQSVDMLAKNVQHLDNVLEVLDAQQDSLVCLFVLLTKLRNQTVTEESIKNVQEFINVCNGEQIRVAAELFVELCHIYSNFLVEQKRPMKGILYLAKAIKKLQFDDSQLTSIHADLCQLSLLAKCFKTALTFLDSDISNICTEAVNSNANSPQFDVKYFLLYYYYGGMIYLAVRNLDRALYCFEVVVTTPAHAVSHIMLEAYKKFIIASLLLHGKVQTLPKYVSQIISRFIKPLSQPYLDLANAFMSNKTSDVNTIVSKHNEVFVRDSNMGLVRQVVSALYKKNIQRLTKTFVTLSLLDVANRVHLPNANDAEAFILQMIEDKQIYATISQKDGMVVFLDEPDKYGSADMLKNLEVQMQICMDMDKQILQMDESIQINPLFVKKIAGLPDDEPSKNSYVM